MKYVALVGLNYPDGHGGELRAEVGDDVPAVVIKKSPWLAEQQLVEKVGEDEEEVSDDPLSRE